MKKGIAVFLLMLFVGVMQGVCGGVVGVEGRESVERFSVAGFLPMQGSPRTVEGMNVGWRIFRGAVDGGGAHKRGFDHSGWEVVSLPNGVEVLPVEASGGVNYRGEVWYRKEFSVSKDKYKGRRVMLYFEGIMGKSRVWMNGELVAENYGGYLPVVVDVTEYLRLGGENVVAVWADNSDDPMYPPGKPQSTLDFCYFGGIYRDCWLVATAMEGYITDENLEGIAGAGGGGVVVSYSEVGESRAVVDVVVGVGNDTKRLSEGVVEFSIGGERKSVPYSVRRGGVEAVVGRIVVENPKLWSPESPDLYDLGIVIKNVQDSVLDGYVKRVGIRTFEFTADRGFVLNGKAYPRRLIGANRHQDFALVGNALSNSLHWRDAQKLKDAGMEIIRNAHYPQDPAFMDACDALGLFVIVNTPGWQFWNDEPVFKERVYSDIRQMVRRDRSRPSVIMWEPILNETWYPADFAQTVHNIVKEEMPYKPNYTASDLEARGSEYLDIKFCHPTNGDPNWSPEHLDPTIVTFTREFGDNVDNWNSHNSPSRVAIQWGETPQLIQAQGYIKPDYPYTSVDALYRAPVSHIGGTLWHSFDHQRGYHPDPFYGGIMTAFRRPKLSYYAFQSQAVWQKPMVYIANLMTPFSPQDVTVYSNCDSVRLYTPVDDSVRVYKRDSVALGAPSPIIVFEKAWDVMVDKSLNRSKRTEDSYLLAEGYQDGVLVAQHKVMPARRTTRLKIVVDTMGVSPVADGSDLMVVVAQITDDQGNIKRLNDQWVTFSVEGEAELVTDNPQNSVKIVWGEAPALLRTTTTAGVVKLTAEITLQGEHTPQSTTVEFSTNTPHHSMLYKQSEVEKKSKNTIPQHSKKQQKITPTERKKLQSQLQEVEKQQDEFGEKR